MIQNFLTFKFRKLVKQGSIPWAAITVWGFADSPVTWGDNLHGFVQSGENDYTFVIFPDDTYWHFAALGSHDTYS